MQGFGRLLNGNTVFALAAVALLGACTTPFEARVQSFQQMPAASSQTFYVQPSNPALSNNLEFQTYAVLVSNEMRKAGFVPAGSAKDAYLLVKFDFGVGDGRERIATRPGTMQTWGWYGRGWYGAGSPMWRGSFNDPFWGWGSSSWGAPEVYSYTLYPTFVSVDIHRTADNVQVFQGRSSSNTRVNDAPTTVPKLVTALFTDFPGQSAQSKVVQVPRR